MSESDAAGKLTKIPGIVDAEATKPVQSVGVPRLRVKGFSAGDLDMVELRIAKKPITQSVKKTVSLVLLGIFISHAGSEIRISDSIEKRMQIRMCMSFAFSFASIRKVRSFHCRSFSFRNALCPFLSMCSIWILYLSRMIFSLQNV